MGIHYYLITIRFIFAKSIRFNAPFVQHRRENLDLIEFLQRIVGINDDFCEPHQQILHWRFISH